MTTDIDRLEVLETGALKKTGDAYHLVALGEDHIDQILALEDIAFRSLGADEQHYLLRKDRAYFEKHFAAGGTMLGIAHEGRLIAQSIVINPTAARPATGMSDMKIDADAGKNGRTHALAEVAVETPTAGRSS